MYLVKSLIGDAMVRILLKVQGFSFIAATNKGVVRPFWVNCINRLLRKRIHLPSMKVA